MAAACGLWFVYQIRTTLIRNFQKTCVGSLHMDKTPVGSTWMNTPGLASFSWMCKIVLRRVIISGFIVMFLMSYNFQLQPLLAFIAILCVGRHSDGEEAETGQSRRGGVRHEATPGKLPGERGVRQAAAPDGHVALASRQVGTQRGTQPGGRRINNRIGPTGPHLWNVGPWAKWSARGLFTGVGMI